MGFFVFGDKSDAQAATMLQACCEKDMIINNQRVLGMSVGCFGNLVKTNRVQRELFE